MKKTCSIFLTVILVIIMISSATAAGYTLQEKLERQLLVGSGLKGSFAVHADADPELNPLVYSVRNSAFEVRGIGYEGNQHYYIYQPGENEERNALTEYYLKDGRGYLRSDLLGSTCYILPTADHLINAWLKSEGENPSIFPDLLRMLLNRKEEENFSTENLERQIEMWITAFSTETSVQSGDGSPRLNQTFRIPLPDLYRAVTDLIRTITTNEVYLSYFQTVLSKEQMDAYLNPELGYYYLEAMEQLDMKGDILFSRTVSTMGELIQSSLMLPMDAEKTGYASVTFENNETRKSVFFSGPRGILYLELPVNFDMKNEYVSNADIRFAYTDNENEGKKNIALKILLTKGFEQYEDTDENRVHEIIKYAMNISREPEGLPEEIKEDLFPEMAPADIQMEIHYSSKPQPSSPTTVEFSFMALQGQYSLDVNGVLKTASPWIFSPFDIAGSTDTEKYTKNDFINLQKTWIKNAEEKLERIPTEASGETQKEQSSPDGQTDNAAIPDLPEDKSPEEDTEPIGDNSSDHTEG